MKFLLVDDHVLFREGVALVLRSGLPDVEITEAGSCSEAFETLAGLSGIDLVLMDLQLPGMSGLDGITQMRSRFPEVPVVALSSSDDKETVLRALDAGAMGYIPKSSPSSVLVGALKLIMAKGIYLPPSVFLGARTETDARERTRGPLKSPTDLGLTPRQSDVLYLLLQGKPAKVICRELNLSPTTVKVHTSAVLRALNVTTRTQAVVAAGKMGLRFGDAV